MGDSPAAAWWQLLRAGNVFTAISNILAGYALARGAWSPVLPLVFLTLASVALYLAGMVLNDVFDLEQDRLERPERPLPSGRIEPWLAKLVGWGLLVDGLSAAGVAAWLLSSWYPLVVAILLAISIVAYDAILKKSAAGPWAMGLCRALNVLLGASVVSDSGDPRAAYLYAFALGMYTLGLTLLARREAEQSNASDLRVASYVIQLGTLAMLLLATVLTLPRFGWFAAWLICLLAVRVQLYEAIVCPEPKVVQKSVARLITMFIPLDALACSAISGWAAGFAVLALLLPTYVATRRAPMT